MGMEFFYTKEKGHQSATRTCVFLTTGTLPNENEIVAHHCDNPSCVRPDHLFVTTQSLNVHDCLSKNRFPVGEDRPGSKLTKEQVLDILANRGRLSSRELAKKHNVSFTVVQRVLRNQSYTCYQG